MFCCSAAISFPYYSMTHSTCMMIGSVRYSLTTLVDPGPVDKKEIVIRPVLCEKTSVTHYVVEH